MGLKNNPRERMDTIFATILADGKIHVAVTKETEGAVLRQYATEDDKKSGNDKKGILSGEKYEHVYTEISGIIDPENGLKFHEGQYGLNLLIVFTAEGEDKPITLALGTESNFGEDVMKKLANIDLKKEVTFAPYSFDDKTSGKKKRGVSITQKVKGEVVKIVSFYHDTEKKTTTNGFPKPPVAPKGKKLPSSKWRDYFRDAREFMIEDLRERLDITDVDSEGEAVGAKGKKGNDFGDFK